MAGTKAVDFDHYEINVYTVADTNPTGFNGTSWTGSPNNVADWNGTDKTLKAVTTTVPFDVTGLSPGIDYYVKIVEVDTSGNRSAPSAQLGAVMSGTTQRSSSLVVAAYNASAASKAGADYICTGTYDEVIINAAINAVSLLGGTVNLTEGDFSTRNQITFVSNVNLTGRGVDATKITGTFCEVISFPVVTNCTLCNLSIIGVATPDPIAALESMMYKGNVIVSSGSKITIKDINLNCGGLKGIVMTATDDSLISDCTVTNSPSWGIYVGEPKQFGYVLPSGNPPSPYSNSSIVCNTTVRGCKVSGCFSGIYVNGAEYCKLDDNFIYSNTNTGIFMSLVSSSIVSINRCIGNGGSGNSGIYISSTATSNNLQGNICRKGTGTYIQGYGIMNSGKYTVISGNDCYDGGSSYGIYEGGTNTSMGSNRVKDGTWSTSPS